MGKNQAQRRHQMQVGKIQPPENRPPQDDDSDPIKVLNNLKKEQLINYYAERYGISQFILSNIWDYLQTATPQRIKQIKKGNIKNIIKRCEYREGDILKHGKVIGNLNNTLKEIVKMEDVL